MALSRLDLSVPVVRRRLAVLSAALVVGAYGLSLLLAGKDALKSMAEGGPSPSSSAASAMGSGSGGMPELPMSELLFAGPHSGAGWRNLATG